MQRPLIPLLVSLIAGIITGNLFHLPDSAAMGLLVFFSIALIIAIVQKRKIPVALSVLSLFFILGILNINLYLHRKPVGTDIARYTGKDTVSVEGLIRKPPRVFPHKTDLNVGATKIITNGQVIPVTGNILLSVKDAGESFQYGDLIRAKTKLKKPHNFNNPGGFDYERYLLFRGIAVRGFIDNPAKMVLIRANRGNIWKQQIEQFRTKLRKLIRKTSPNGDGTILQALILGEKEAIPENIREDFNRAGISHILAISGLHIGIIAFLSVICIRTVMKSSEYLLLKFNITKTAALLTVIPIMSYAFVAGFGISTVRAVIMILVFLVAVFIEREQDLFNTLALAALIILVISPVSLFDVSFQLSFTAVASILIITPRLSPFIPRRDDYGTGRAASVKNSMVYTIMLFIIVSIAATVGTFPLIAFYFNRLSTVVLLSNLVIIPIVGFIVLPLGLLTIAVAPFSGPCAASLITAAAFFAGIANDVIHYLASFPFSAFFVVTPTLTELACYYALVIAGIMLLGRWKAPASDREDRQSTRKDTLLKIVSVLLCLFFIYDCAALHYAVPHWGRLRATFLDVGQGSSTLVEFPEGTTMLVDGGGFYGSSFDVGKNIVAPFLWHRRINRIDIVVLTHPHQDHLNGLLFILENFPVGEVWSNGAKMDMESYGTFRRLIRTKNIPYRVMSEETTDITVDGTVIAMLNPEQSGAGSPPSSGGDDSNNRSLVMKITFGKVGILLPADIMASAEYRIVSTGKDIIMSTAILVPHHGGGKSSTMAFLDSVEPDIAVISRGEDERFRPVDPAVLKRYNKVGARVYRTDIDGAVTVETDGKDIHRSCEISREGTPSHGGSQPAALRANRL